MIKHICKNCKKEFEPKTIRFNPMPEITCSHCLTKQLPFRGSLKEMKEEIQNPRTLDFTVRDLFLNILYLTQKESGCNNDSKVLFDDPEQGLLPVTSLSYACREGKHTGYLIISAD